MPACADICCNLKKFPGVDDYSDLPHKKNTKARQVRDHNDTIKMLAFLLQRNPFKINVENIINICTGKAASKETDVDRAKQIGNKIVSAMDGKCVTDVSFKKKDQATQIKNVNIVRSNEKEISIDSLLFFQLLLTVREITSKMCLLMN